MIELSNEELAFGKRLAHVDKEVRDVAVEKLTQLLSTEDEFEYMDMLRQWKALFYCFWLSDMPLVQQELSWALANMILCCQGANRVMFVRAFWETICREWYDIDKHRVDKYLLLMRRIVFFTFRSMQQGGWDEKLVSDYIDAYTQFPINPSDPKIPHSTRLHVADVFVDELVRVSTEILKSSDNPRDEVSKIPVAALLEPFMRFIGSSSIKTLPPRVQESVFENMVVRIAQAEDRAAISNEDASSSEDESVLRDNQIEHETLERVQFLIDNMPSIKQRVFAVAGEEGMRSLGRKRLFALYQMLCDTFPEEGVDVPLAGDVVIREPLGPEARKIANKHKRRRALKTVERKEKKKERKNSILRSGNVEIDINALENEATSEEKRSFQQDVAKIRQMEKRTGISEIDEIDSRPKSKKGARVEKKKNKDKLDISQNAATSTTTHEAEGGFQDVPQLIPVENPLSAGRQAKTAKQSSKRPAADSESEWVVKSKLSSPTSVPANDAKRRRSSDQSLLAEALKKIVVKDKVASPSSPNGDSLSSGTPAKRKGVTVLETPQKTPTNKSAAVAVGSASSSGKKRLAWALERNSVKRFSKQVPMLPSTEDVSTTPKSSLKPALRKQSAYKDVPILEMPALTPLTPTPTKAQRKAGANGHQGTPVRGSNRHKKRS
ncbi:hypothetical protein LPJ73_000071 [Coemansia sp. RSA 2703]|nr:hypothetical protein LPJ73_000071 [Coemansia sp. RSA 2703]KAJ2371543.1 hypothetical protein IW150_004545 [Coemansia sp. RSA 2607]KAJ2393958.1 hypothetical protein GGI05_002256 [Coemansia sp. RSA 2603]